MRDQVTLFNIALGVAGARASLTSVEDHTIEAEKCRLFYETARDEVFSAFYWGSLRSTARLVQVAERDLSVDWADTDPRPGYRFAHRLPVNFHYPQFLSNWSQFELSRIGDELVLMSDAEHPILTYTRKESNLGVWEPMLFSLVAAYLGVKVAIALKVDEKAYRRAVEHLQGVYSSAITAAANQDLQVIQETLPEWIEARGFVGLSAPVRFFYPTQALLYGHNQTLV